MQVLKNSKLWYNPEKHRFYLYAPKARSTVTMLYLGWFLTHQKGIYYTPFFLVADRLYHQGNAGAKKQLDFTRRWYEEQVKKAYWLEPPVNFSYGMKKASHGLSLFPYQEAALWILNERLRYRNGAILGDDMGIGKTIEALAYAADHPEFRKILIVCPKQVISHWWEQIETWVPYWTRSKKYRIVVTNYEQLKNLKRKDYHCVICDEAHYIKNPTAKRTKLIMQILRKRVNFYLSERRYADYPKALFLTGTPVLNRPLELYPILHLLLFRGRIHNPLMFYMLRYCGWFGVRRPDGKGASNTEELNKLLRAQVMIRREKNDVLPWLPEKIRQICVIPATGKLAELNKKANWQEVIEGFKRRQRIGMAANLQEIQRESAFLKLPRIFEFLEILEGEGVRKVVLFAQHIPVIKALAEKLGDQAVTFYGKTSMRGRREALDRFENDPGIHYFIAQIRAAGTGLDKLKVASYCVFVQLDWTPAVLEQAEDRLLRIGQKNTVNIYYFVVEGSFDEYMIRVFFYKQKNIKKILH